MDFTYANFNSLAHTDQINMLKCLFDPIVFSKEFLDINIFDYQASIIGSKHPRLFIQKGRQVGISYILALKAVHQAITNPSSTIAVVAPSQRQSSLVFKYIMNFFKCNPFLRPEIESTSARCSQTTIELANGSIIYSLPCGNDGHTIRGISIPKGGILIVDEAAYIPEKAWDAIDYFTAAGGQSIISSTPLTKRGRFFELSEDDTYEKYKITTWQNPIVDKVWIDSRKKYRSYTTEIMAEFMDGDGNFFNEDQVRACINADLSWECNPQSISGYQKYMGVDVALEVDPCVVTLVYKDKNGIFIPAFIRAYKKDNGKDSYDCEYKVVNSYDEIINEIKFVNDRYGPIVNASIDATYNPYLAERVEKFMPTTSVKFNSSAKNGNPMKTELMYTLLGAISERKIQLPNHPDLIRQLLNYEHTITDSKNIKFSDTDEDFIDSLALAVYNEVATDTADNFFAGNV